MKVFRFRDPLCSWNEKLYMDQWEIIKETEKGYWIRLWSFDNIKKWVPKEGKNLFAFDTIEKAIFNYRKRKEKQIKILKARLDQAKMNLKACDDSEYKVKQLTFVDWERIVK